MNYEKKFILTTLALFFSNYSNSYAASVETINTHEGMRVVAYTDITKRLTDPLDNCRQLSVTLIPLGRIKLHHENGYFHANVAKKNRRIYIDLRDFDSEHFKQINEFIRPARRYLANMQECGNAQIIDLIDIKAMP